MPSIAIQFAAIGSVAAFVFPALVAQTTLTFDHVHMVAPDPAKAAQWYAAHLGGATGSGDDRVTWGETILAFIKASGPVEPSAGTVIDHIGFSVANLEMKIEEVRTAGATVLDPIRDVPGVFRIAFIQDPWGGKVELVEDPDIRGFHHVHLRVPDAAAALSWYERMFGGVRGKLKGRIDGVRYGDVWLLAQSSGGKDVPLPKGHAIDHIGWRPENLDTEVVSLQGKGAKITSEPRDYGKLRYAFVEGPAGIPIELTQRPQ